MCENNKYDANFLFAIFIWNENKIYTLQRIVLDKVGKTFVQFKNACKYWLPFSVCGEMHISVAHRFKEILNVELLEKRQCM